MMPVEKSREQMQGKERRLTEERRKKMISKKGRKG